MATSDRPSDASNEPIEVKLIIAASDGFVNVTPEKYERIRELLDSFERETRLALLREMAAEECVACKDGAELFRDEESGEWAHERLGKPNFLCEAPEIIADWLWQAEQPPAAQPPPEVKK